MHKVPKEEMLGCQTWYDLVDYMYKGQDDLPSGIVHCDMGSIPEFFEKISQTDNTYIVVSSRSDFGLFYQQRHPPYRDFHKIADMFASPEALEMGYQPMTIPPPIKTERCKKTDKYSIKCHLYTEATFDEIPKQVNRWLLCNNGVLDDPRLIGIPFGINNVDGDDNAFNVLTAKRENLNWNGDHPDQFYVNFAFYTGERAKLFQLYQQNDWATCEQSLPFNEYVDHLALHNTVLCPPGNGLDCYRTLEALYLGVIPIMQQNELSVTYARLRLPVLILESLEAVTLPVLEYIKKAPLNNREQWDLTVLTKTFWKGVLDDLRTKMDQPVGVEANG